MKLRRTVGLPHREILGEIPELYFLRAFLSALKKSFKGPSRRYGPQQRNNRGPKVSKKAIGVLILICIIAFFALIGFQFYLNSRTCSVAGQPIWGFHC